MNEFDDPFDLHGQSQPSGRVDRNGQEIRLLGRPILAWNPSTSDLTFPTEYRAHPLIQARYFYTLPLSILEEIVASVGEDKFDVDTLAMERRLSNICRDNASIVGFWKEKTIAYRELRPNNVEPFRDKLFPKFGLDPVKVNHAMKLYRERDVLPIDRFSRGYCGWLLTNKQFLDEHDRLLTKHAEAVRCWGTHEVAEFLARSSQSEVADGNDPRGDELWIGFVADCKSFLLRWRLTGLAGPYLPMPSKPLMAGTFPLTSIQQLMEAGGLFYLPDTMPIPSRDQLRGMLDDALHRGEKPDHLAEWLDIVRSDNTARNRMDPFARLFELQHYWRILHERHASAVHRKFGRLEEVFGDAFEVQSQQIRHDLIDIRKKLGTEWLERPWPI